MHGPDQFLSTETTPALTRVPRRTPRWAAWLLPLAIVACGEPEEDQEEVTTPQPAHGDVSLPGSQFEIDSDANLAVDHPAPSFDWGNVDEIRKPDAPSGAADDSFGQGAKEDTAVPAVVDGSIPPNKSDLLTFGVYLEQNGSGRFLHVFWHRVQEPTGTTNMDFEFNQSETLSANGITPVRTAGDLLIQYDLAQGGTNPQLFVSRWRTSAAQGPCEASNSYPCWGARANLTSAGDATGSINTTAIAADDSDGLGSISPRTFGEATVDFDALVSGSECVAFGSAYLKSRSSDSFTSALKDFIAPEDVDIQTCGSIKIIKTDDAGTPLAGATFQVLQDNTPIGGTPGAEDTDRGSCTTGADGTCTVGNLPEVYDYWVVETVVPPGHDGVDPQHVTTVTAETTVELTLVNPRQRGAILVTKTRKHAAEGSGDHPHAGVDFTVNGVTKATGLDGTVCFDGLLFGSYTVTETVPTGYVGEAPKSVTVNNSADCDDDPFGGETVSFSNTPLSNITVSFESQIVGGTAAQISCTGLTATPPDATPSVYDDVSETFEDLQPGTYTCTIVIDP